MGDVHTAVRSAGWKICVVVDDDGCILGRIRGEAFEADPSRTAEDVMEPGPTTQRPDVRLGSLTQRMRARGTEHVLVSRADGKLFGVFFREDAEKLEEAARHAMWRECEGCRGTWREDYS